MPVKRTRVFLGMGFEPESSAILVTGLNDDDPLSKMQVKRCEIARSDFAPEQVDLGQR